MLYADVLGISIISYQEEAGVAGSQTEVCACEYCLTMVVLHEEGRVPSKAFLPRSIQYICSQKPSSAVCCTLINSNKLATGNATGCTHSHTSLAPVVIQTVKEPCSSLSYERHMAMIKMLSNKYN